MFGNPKQLPGGRALKFLCFQSVWVFIGSTHKSRTGDQKIPNVSKETKIKVTWKTRWLHHLRLCWNHVRRRFLRLRWALEDCQVISISSKKQEHGTLTGWKNRTRISESNFKNTWRITKFWYIDHKFVFNAEAWLAKMKKGQQLLPLFGDRTITKSNAWPRRRTKNRSED